MEADGSRVCGGICHCQTCPGARSSILKLFDLENWTIFCETTAAGFHPLFGFSWPYHAIPTLQILFNIKLCNKLQNKNTLPSSLHIYLKAFPFPFASQVRTSALRALRRLPGRSAALHAALGDGDAAVRSAAWAALVEAPWDDAVDVEQLVEPLGVSGALGGRGFVRAVSWALERRKTRKKQAFVGGLGLNRSV